MTTRANGLNYMVVIATIALLAGLASGLMAQRRDRGFKQPHLPKGWQYRARTLTRDLDWSLVPTRRSTPSGTSASNRRCGFKKPFDTGDVKPPIEVAFEPDGGSR